MTGRGGRRPAGLTAEQRRALAVRGASVALSAGAGCGKTTVLTERFLAALEGDESRPLHTVVAVTFTEKAARELRQRIRRACHDRLSASKDENDSVAWRAVLRGLEAAPVSTFHEYCSGLLRRHALAARVDPDFQVLDAPLAATVRDEALTRSLRLWLSAGNDDLVALAVEFGLAGVRESLGTLVGRRDAAEVAAWGCKTVDEVVTLWERNWAERGRPAERERFLRAARAFAGCLEPLEFTHAKLVSFRRHLRAALQDAEKFADRKEWVGGLRELASLPKGLKKEQWPSSGVNAEVRAAGEVFRAALKSWVGCDQWDAASSRVAAEHGLRFARLSAEARREYDAAKAVRGALDFDDLLLLTRDFLRGHAGLVRGESGRGVAFVLVDEFQDTDPVQAEILRLLTGEAFSDGKLFVVGDFKQSIYRFRGARPEIFQQFRAEFPEAGRRDLSENFRSTTGVVDFVNAAFADAFPGESPRLLPGPDAQPAADGPAVEFVWAGDGGERDDAEPPDKSSARDGRRVEARWLARLVRKRLDAGWPVRDKESKLVRHAHAGDVAFLFRAMTDAVAYEQALAAEGLDYHVVGGSAFYAQQEVQDLVNVLSAVEDPLDAVALAGALRSPFFGLSDDALFWLAAPGSGGLTGRFYDPDPSTLVRLSADDRRQASRACELLGRWSGLKDRLPIAGLVDRVLDESGYEPALLGEFLGGRKRANARKLVRLARRFDARGGFTLAHFVRRLRADLREPPREEQAATTDEEGTSVRLMSVHQAKGLEFPIVVLPDLNRVSNNSRGSVVFDPELGPLVRLDTDALVAGGEWEGDEAGQSLGWTSYQRLERDEDEAEAVRLFYVATTRARDALILSAACDPGKKPASPALRLLDERFDRRTGACRVALPEGWAVPDVRVTTECPPSPPQGGSSRKQRPDLGAVARLITSTPVRASVTPPIPAAPRPRLIDLDAARRLSPRATRLDRLIRSVLGDAESLRAGSFAEAVSRAAWRQVPVAHGGLVGEAVRFLEPRLQGDLGRLIAGASTVERGFEWSVTWPADRPGATVVLGRADFILGDKRGLSTVVNVSPPGSDEPVERLRWVLSAYAANAKGFGPVGPGWRVVLGGGLRGEDAFDTAAVDAAFLAVVSPVTR